MSKNIGRARGKSSYVALVSVCAGTQKQWDTRTQTHTWDDTFITCLLHGIVYIIIEAAQELVSAMREPGELRYRLSLSASNQRLEKGQMPCPKAIKSAPHRGLSL